MKIAIKILFVIVLCFSFTGLVKADSAPPTEQTTFYFQQNGQPLTQPVKINIKCYGTSMLVNEEGLSDSKDLLKISEMSETCSSYGCKLSTSNIFEVYRKNIKYCDLEGEINGQKFTINNFLGNNLSGLSCHGADFDILKNDHKYYKYTPQYNECIKNVYREYYPQGNGSVKGNFLCAQYETEDKLIPTNKSTEFNGPCYHYGYTIKNNICYQIPQEFFDCVAGEDKKIEACDQYLEDVTAKLEKDKNGYFFEKICDANIIIPEINSDTQLTQNKNIEPTTINQQSTEQLKSKGILTQIIDFFRCTFLKMFGKSC